jgi:activator of 2-hydroxyglutaryl-CoA dehydratase/predicted nucleotide-binding protein (sugar kinase/HSP70/actin superfamily)
MADAPCVRDVNQAPAAVGGGENPGLQTYVGFDVGVEAIKAVEVVRAGAAVRVLRHACVEHDKDPGRALRSLLAQYPGRAATGAASTGRLARLLTLPHIPAKQAQSKAFRALIGDQPATLVCIGSRGFSVLELRGNGLEVFRQNGRCSQGTGNFLRQLVARFSLSVAEASELCADVESPAPLSGRCPVILKTDMTHLANKGEDRQRILAGLFDAVCENVMTLLKPGISPPDVYLIGGVSRSRRIARTFGRILERAGMRLHPLPEMEAVCFEAIGAALAAPEGSAPPPGTDGLLAPPIERKFDRVPALTTALARVRRLPALPRSGIEAPPTALILGFDIGSTGSKLVALDPRTEHCFWEGYGRTDGNPVRAAQSLLARFLAENPAGPPVQAFGVTGSGREIVGSLLSTCYCCENVFILNEIAAHAAGALHHDPRVDTIFEIGGQDAKYIRLAEGRVVDCAMNEACSAGTGSFIEEQGSKFAGIASVVQLGAEALRAEGGISLGQHCSVFMAEIIDEAVAAHSDPREIIAGLYDSIIQNYLHRVKGNRSVGQVIFCQGMPFAADALAAAVARQTGAEVIVPPNPGTIGALGIALLTQREITQATPPEVDLQRFLEARVEAKDTFICKATTGCGGAGNKCRIDRLQTVVAGQQQRFTWGGGCSLYDKGTRRKKLPDLAPDPFREREELVQQMVSRFAARAGGKRVALSDEFMLKGLFPFFATYLHALGCELVVVGGADHATLKRGVQEANLPFCAPMQLYHGLAGRMAEETADFVFIPLLRSTPRVAAEWGSAVCPIVQGCADILRWDFQAKLGPRLISTPINFGQGNLDSREFLASCRQLATDLGVGEGNWTAAHRAAVTAQTGFETHCLEIGARALAFCRAHDVVPVVVLGRPYTLYNKVLNSNVPALLREQGSLALPVDCYPVSDQAPVFDDIYWGYSQRILRAAHEVRRAPGVYSLFCSNYGCGPDSFNLHFYSHLMEGKPFAIIETDGHSGDAGTKTRVEAFLYCVAQDRRAGGQPQAANDLRKAQIGELTLAALQPEERLLIPYLGPASETIAACLRGRGFQAETLAMPDAESLRLGRRHTSGKECVPMCLTLGSLLKRIEPSTHNCARFMLLMPRTCGPCRYGVYNVLNRLTLDRLGWNGRLRIWSPKEAGYFDDLPAGFALLAFSGFMAADLLLDGLLDARPGERQPGAAQRIYEHHHAKLLRLLETEGGRDLGAPSALWQVVSGRCFGIGQLLAEAAAEFAAARGLQDQPVVLVVGEMYVRNVPSANDAIIEKLEERGCRVRLAPVTEYLEYTDFLNTHRREEVPWSTRLSVFLQSTIRQRNYQVMARALDWPARAPVQASLDAAEPYVRVEIEGEAGLTVGTALHEWQCDRIDAVISVGPLECMPNKIAEAQFFHVAEQEGLPSLTVPLNGDPMSLEPLDNFVFEVHSRFRQGRKPNCAGPTCPGGHC